MREGRHQKIAEPGSFDVFSQPSNRHAEYIGNDHWIRISESKLWQSFLGEKIQVLKGLPYRVSFSTSICPPKQLYNKFNWYDDIIRIRILSLYHLLVNPRHLHCRTG